MLLKLAAPRALLPRSSRGFSQSLSSPRNAKPQLKTIRAQQRQPRPESYSRLGTAESLLCVDAASNYYSFGGQDGEATMNQSNGPKAQATQRKPKRLAGGSGGPPHQPSAQSSSVSSGVGGNEQLAQAFQQQAFPVWTPMHLNMGSNGANNGVGFQGFPVQNDSNAFNTNPMQPLIPGGFPPQSFAPSFATTMNENAGGFYNPSNSWPPPDAPQNGHHANNNSMLNSQHAPYPQQNAVSSASLPVRHGTASGRPAAKASTSSAADRHRLDITAPSQRSGGIPDPTDAYLMRASFLPKRCQQPGPLLVVIDLNGTLLYRPSRKNSTSFQSRRHTQEFVTYCVQTFWVVFWSSAKPENVKGMVDQLLNKSLRRQVVGVWGRDKFGLTEQDYNKRTQCYKRLTKLWDDPLIKSSYPSQRPGFEGGCWDQGNTVLIDDSIEKARSEPHNAITLPEYLGGADDDSSVLPNVHDYLNELCHQEDVSAYMRAHPFRMS